MSFLLKRSPAAARRPPEVDGVQLIDMDSCPALAEFLTLDFWPDGSSRKPGTMLVFYDDYRVKACLSDRDQGLVLFVTCDAISLAVAACDEALRNPDADWRPAKNGDSRRSGKRG
jgi:hypothetical protein